MATYTHGTREVRAVIVYVGAGLSGKTTNVKYLGQQMGVRVYGSLTEGERTPMMDWIPVTAALPHDWTLRLQVRSLPGQLQYDETRRLFLRQPDGIVFVADSHPARMDANHASLLQVVETLRANGVDPQTVPLVVQYNKRDLAGRAPWRQMDAELNPGGAEAFVAEAATGVGVFETFRAIYLRVRPRIEEEIERRHGPAFPLG